MTLRDKLEQLRTFGADGSLKDSELEALLDVALAAHISSDLYMRDGEASYVAEGRLSEALEALDKALGE